MNATDWYPYGSSRSASESCAFSSEAEGVESSDTLTGTTGCIIPVGGAHYISPPLKRIAVAAPDGDPLSKPAGPQRLIPPLSDLTAASPAIPGRPSGDGRHITQVRQARHARVVAAPNHHSRRTHTYGGIRW